MALEAKPDGVLRRIRKLKVIIDVKGQGFAVGKVGNAVPAIDEPAFVAGEGVGVVPKGGVEAMDGVCGARGVGEDGGAEGGGMGELLWREEGFEGGEVASEGVWEVWDWQGGQGRLVCV